MTPEEILDAMDAVLTGEREALRRLDGAAVARAAAEKERLLGALRAADLAARSDLAPRWQALRAGLQRNLVLLAHARDCLDDVLATAAPGARLSVTG